MRKLTNAWKAPPRPETQGPCTPLVPCWITVRAAPKTAKKALYWYEKAAKKNHPNAQFYCGWDYHEGIGCAVDYARAFFWLGKAAEQNCADAQFVYGVMYHNGKGCTANRAEGTLWLKKAAEKGHEEAIRLLESV